MKRIIIATTAFVLACGQAMPAKAQVVLDLSLITCQQLLAPDTDILAPRRILTHSISATWTETGGSSVTIARRTSRRPS